MKYCPYCGSALQEGMVYCPKCGQKFIDAGAGAAQKGHGFAEPSSSVSKGKHEKKTDYNIDNDSGLTSYLSPEQEHLKDEESNIKRTNNVKSKKHHVVILLIIAIVLCLSAVLLVVFLGGSGVPQPVLSSRESVVRVVSEYSDGYALGSGFIVFQDQADTYIVTNAHVVEDHPISITVLQNGLENSATIKRIDEDKDLCILVTAHLQGHPVSLSDSDVKQGTAIYAAGFPSAADVFSDQLDSNIESITLTNGIVSALRSVSITENGKPLKLLQVNAAINPGNSGGPLLDKLGRVVGVNTFGAEEAQGIFAAIAVSELRSMLSEANISAVQVGGISSLMPHNVSVWVYVVAAAILAIIILIAVSRRRYLSKLTQEEVKKEKIKRRKKRKKLIIVTVLLLVIICASAAAVVYAPYYFVDKGDISKAKLFIINSELRSKYDPMYDPTLEQYIEAVALFEEGDYESASVELSKLPYHYKNKMDYYYESNYLIAKQLADNNEWDEAIEKMVSLSQADYKDSKALVDEFVIKYAQYKESVGDIRGAYDLILSYSDQGYKGAIDYLPIIRDKLYEAEEYDANKNLDEPIGVNYVIQHYGSLMDKHFILDALVSSTWYVQSYKPGAYIGFICCADTSHSNAYLSGSTSVDGQMVKDDKMVSVSFDTSNDVETLINLKRGDHVLIKCNGISYSEDGYYEIQFESIEVLN